jgi:chromobox protein 1
MTWEPADNLETAEDIFKAYIKSIGGTPAPPASGKRRGPKPGTKKRARDDDTPNAKAGNGTRPSQPRAKKQNTGEDDDSEVVIMDIPPSRKSRFPPKTDDWDKYIVEVTTIEERQSQSTGEMERWGMVTWEDGHHTRHRLGLLHSKAPQKVRIIAVLLKCQQRD